MFQLLFAIFFVVGVAQLFPEDKFKEILQHPIDSHYESEAFNFQEPIEIERKKFEPQFGEEQEKRNREELLRKQVEREREEERIKIRQEVLREELERQERRREREELFKKELEREETRKWGEFRRWMEEEEKGIRRQRDEQILKGITGNPGVRKPGINQERRNFNVEIPQIQFQKEEPRKPPTFQG